MRETYRAMEEDGAGKVTQVFRVAEINRLAKQCLEGSFSDIWIEGEISNLRPSPSGHVYFSLKDAGAQLAAVLFRGHRTALIFEPANGQMVRARGTLTVYEQGGRYQLVVRDLKPAGAGALQAAFEELKKRLEQEGLFRAERKRKLPMLPRHVGVVTSPTGAAVRDILQVVTRRFPNLHLLIAPVPVQGPDAGRRIARAIDYLNERGGLDVLIVGRGGGSMEDLWCFNEECVARAIFSSRIPVISAVGHEIDYTISDFVADMRAPTPSAAAELLVNRKETFEDTLARAEKDLRGLLSDRVRDLRSRLKTAAVSHVFHEPGHMLRHRRQRINHQRDIMVHRLVGQLRDARQNLDRHGQAQDSCLRAAVKSHREVLNSCLSKLQDRVCDRVRSGREMILRGNAHLQALDPRRVLRRGFSLTRNAEGVILRRAGEVSDGEIIFTELAEGRLKSRVQREESENDRREKED